MATVAPTPTRAAPADAARRVVISFDGLGEVTFGRKVDEAVEAMTRVFGGPDEDSGWIGSFSPFGTCPGDKVRAVEWHGLRLLFTDGATRYAAAGQRHFFAYDYFGDDLDRTALRTAKGVGIGSTVAAVRSAYQDATLSDGPPYGATIRIRQGAATIVGFLDSTDDDGVVESLSGGELCAE